MTGVKIIGKSIVTAMMGLYFRALSSMAIGAPGGFAVGALWGFMSRIMGCGYGAISREAMERKKANGHF